VELSGWWWAPVIAGAAGAVVLSALATHLAREVDRLQKSLRPLRTTRVDKTRRSG